MGVVANNTEKHTRDEVRALFHVVRNNINHYSALWSTMRKNNGRCIQQHGKTHAMKLEHFSGLRCGQQRGRIATTQNSTIIFCEPKGIVYLN
jgi:hypothetical protein